MEAGWVCRFFYFDSSVTTLPEVDQLLMLEPNAAAKVDSINISSHKDLWEIAGEEDEEVVMCVYVCMCVCGVWCVCARACMRMSENEEE